MINIDIAHHLTQSPRPLQTLRDKIWYLRDAGFRNVHICQFFNIPQSKGASKNARPTTPYMRERLVCRFDLCREDVSERLSYANGVFHWKSSQIKNLVGKEAGYYEPTGYCRIRLRGHHYTRAHLVWLLHTGEHPSLLVDHINRKRGDDRIGNLRMATHSQNSANMTKKPNTEFSRKGVSRKRGRFVAAVVKNGKRHVSKSFDTSEQAADEYIRMAKVLFGEFATEGLS